MNKLSTFIKKIKKWFAKKNNKKIISGFILLILFCLFIFKKFISSEENFQNNHINNKISIVGNGPLTEYEINEINDYDIIYVLNTVKTGNKKIPIKATHHIIRQKGTENDGFYGWNKDKNEFTINPETNPTNIIFACPTNKESYENINKIKSKFTDKNIEVISSGSEPWTEKKYKFDNILYDHYDSPSTGVIGINYILEKYPSSEIHIYGMNWQLRGGHDTKKEKEYISECPRCIIHKTWKDTYE